MHITSDAVLPNGVLQHTPGAMANVGFNAEATVSILDTMRLFPLSHLLISLRTGYNYFWLR